MAKPLFPEVTVNGQVIASEDIAQEAQNHEAPKGKPGWAWQAGARALVIRELILEEARKMGLSPLQLKWHRANLKPMMNH
ncbi:hypothetical protein [Halocynthiibacter namhaensis]|uniref:hypothetical protein n=1 Tax=Halocynthiibacter namhaensis TaxID=1290553 RepID=UPI000691180E|nr:hypothetical protein [Halocynthiibacter namhaensis]